VTDYVLIYYPPDGGEHRIELEPDRTYRLGSREGNDIVVPQNDVSRNHAILRVSDGSFQVTDLKSKNGTFINGNRTTSARFRAGDLVNLSSARFVVVEAGSGDHSVDSGEQAVRSIRPGSTSDTVQRRIRASSEDLVALLEATVRAVPRGALAEPLAWGTTRLGLEAVVVLYRSADGMVSIVSSAGDLGPLIARGEALGNLASTPMPDDGESPHIRHLHEVGEDILVASLLDSHLMIIRYKGSPPSVGDIQALASAAELVLRSPAASKPDTGKRKTGETGPAAIDPGSFDASSVLGVSLKEASARFERWLVRRTLEACDGNQSLAARELGMSRAGFFKKARRLGILD
jgi:hypothetical protein